MQRKKTEKKEESLTPQPEEDAPKKTRPISVFKPAESLGFQSGTDNSGLPVTGSLTAGASLATFDGSLLTALEPGAIEVTYLPAPNGNYFPTSLPLAATIHDPRPTVRLLSAGGGGLQLEVRGAPTARYGLEQAATLTTSPWPTLVERVLDASGIHVEILSPSGSGPLYFRARWIPPP